MVTLGRWGLLNGDCYGVIDNSCIYYMLYTGFNGYDG